MRKVNMDLRKLELKDAPLMLEWMHDRSVVENLQTNFLEKTMEDCEMFITDSWQNESNLHLAIVDEKDTYMGTVSLKHIKMASAEFGITICKSAMGKGYAKWEMEEIFRMGQEKMKFEQVYWCVNPQNMRALKFYDKNGYARINSLDKDIISRLCSDGIYSPFQIKSYIWYQKELKT